VALWDDYEAVLFDLDGVVTPTAEVHMRAWGVMFNAYLDQLPADSSADRSPYTDRDYFDYVDGMPRVDGVASFLGSRGIELPLGEPDDGPERDTVHGLGNRKNVVFNRVLAEEGVRAYPGSLRLLQALREHGTPMAIVSSSKNAPAVLDAAGVADFFGVVMHGGEAVERGLPGKPAPDTFVAAAADLGFEPARCVVLEDALSGVAAGRAGDFGLVVGVDRGVGDQALRENGADVVVSDLAELV
jgi:beta-phosphoglucomutase family hydrolase